MSAPESFRSIPLHFRDLHGKPQRQQVRKQESRRARDGSGSWRTSCLECVAHIGAGAIILNREMKYTGTHQGAGELRNSKMIFLLALAMLVATGKVCAQTQATGGETPSLVVVPDSGKTQSTEETQKHRFWDKKNDLLFAGVGAARTFDYFSTLNLRRRGDNEILLTNEVLANHAAFAAIEASA